MSTRCARPWCVRAAWVWFLACCGLAIGLTYEAQQTWATSWSVPAVADVASSLATPGPTIAQPAVAAEVGPAGICRRSRGCSAGEHGAGSYLSLHTVSRWMWHGDGRSVSRTPSVVGNVALRQGAALGQACEVIVAGPAQLPGVTQLRHQCGGSWLDGQQVAHRCGRHRLIRKALPNIAVISNAASKRVFRLDLGGYTITSPGDSSWTLVRDTMNYQFILTDWRNGDVFMFHDFQTAKPGLLKEKTTLEWRSAGKEGSVYTHNASNQVTQVTSPDGQDYNLAFNYTGSKITQLEVRTGADTSTRTRRVEYTYFDSYQHSADLGSGWRPDPGQDHRAATGGNPDTASDWIVAIVQYRYGSYGLLKAVYDEDAVARLVADRADIDTPDDILTKGDDDDNSG